MNPHRLPAPLLGTARRKDSGRCVSSDSNLLSTRRNRYGLARLAAVPGARNGPEPFLGIRADLIVALGCAVEVGNRTQNCGMFGTNRPLQVEC